MATEIARRWDLSHEVVLVGWSSDGTALRRLAPSEISCTVTGLTFDNRDLTPTILVPWHCTYVLPELLGETNRVGRFPGLGFDIRTIKVLSSATTACHSRLEKLEQRPRLEPSLVTFLPSLILTAWPLFPQRPPWKFRSWRTMLQGAGIDGPDITPISLPISPSPLDEDAIAFAREHLAVAGLPMVLAVGSHTSVQNQMAVLQATELLWRRGLKFQPPPGG